MPLQPLSPIHQLEYVHTQFCIEFTAEPLFNKDTPKVIIRLSMFPLYNQDAQSYVTVLVTLRSIQNYKAVAREPAPALKHKPLRTGSPYVCMENVHACALVQ